MQPIKHNTQKAQEELTAAKIEEYRQKYEKLKTSGALDPDSPNFNIELFNSDAAIPAEFMQAVNSISEQMLEYMQTPEYKKHAAIEKEIYKFIKNNGYTTDSNGKSCIKDNYKEIFNRAGRLAVLIEEMPELSEGASVEDILKGGFDENGQPIRKEFKPLFLKDLLIPERKHTPQKMDNSLLSTMPLIRDIFEKTNPKKGTTREIDGQLFYDFVSVTENKKTLKKHPDNPEVYILGRLWQTGDIIISRELDIKDRMLIEVLGSFYKEGIKQISLADLFYQMGYNRKPQKKDKEEIIKRLLRLSSTWMQFDNTKEIEHRYKYPPILSATKGTQLLKFDIQQITASNGQSIEIIELNAMPELMRIAIDRRQFTTLHREWLTLPGNTSKYSEKIQRYFLDNITAINDGAINNIMKFESIFDYCELTKDKRMQRDRVKTQIIDFLEHYKKNKFIKDYKINNEEIIITRKEKTAQ